MVRVRMGGAEALKRAIAQTSARAYRRDYRKHIIRYYVRPFAKVVVRRNYAAEGRPTPWPPLSQKTIVKRESLGHSGAHMLNMAGIDVTKRFYFAKSDETGVEYAFLPGKKYIYLRAQETGFMVNKRTIERPYHMEVPTTGGVFHLKKVNIAHPYSFEQRSPYRVPARPVLVMTPEDATEISNKMFNWITEPMRRYGFSTE